MKPLREETDAYRLARQNLSSEARIALAVIEDAIVDGAPDYPGADNRTALPGGVIVISTGGLTVAFLQQSDEGVLMLNVEDENAAAPWDPIE